MGYEQICDAMGVPDFFQVARATRVFPVGFTEQLHCSVEDNCAIHVPLEGADSGKVCLGAATGTHSSIKALYDDIPLVNCHAEPGSRVIDAQLARLVAEMSEGFISRAFHRSKSFQKRFMSGAPVGVSVYGAGYCILRGIDPRARSRVARILGCTPYIIDGIRFIIAVGNWSEDGFALQDVGGGMVHVDSAKVKWTSTLRAVVGRLLQRVQRDPYARVGITSESVNAFEFTDKLSSFSLCVPLRPTPGLLHLWQISINGDRASGFRGWLEAKSIFVDDRVFECLLVASIAGSSLPIKGSSLIRRFGRMWAVVGDVVAKCLVATQCFAEFATPEQYTHALKPHSNELMAVALERSGLRDHCAVSFLSQDSKANADVVEAIIGVLALYADKEVVNKFLIALGLISGYSRPLPFEIRDSETSTVDCEVDAPSLNSRQYIQFLKLYKEGAFGN